MSNNKFYRLPSLASTKNRRCVTLCTHKSVSSRRLFLAYFFPLFFFQFTYPWVTRTKCLNVRMSSVFKSAFVSYFGIPHRFGMDAEKGQRTVCVYVFLCTGQNCLMLFPEVWVCDLNFEFCHVSTANKRFVAIAISFKTARSLSQNIHTHSSTKWMNLAYIHWLAKFYNRDCKVKSLFLNFLNFFRSHLLLYAIYAILLWALQQKQLKTKLQCCKWCNHNWKQIKNAPIIKRI